MEKFKVNDKVTWCENSDGGMINIEALVNEEDFGQKFIEANVTKIGKDDVEKFPVPISRDVIQLLP